MRRQQWQSGDRPRWRQVEGHPRRWWVEDHLRPRQSGGRPSQRRRGGPRAHDVDEQRRVHDEHGGIRTDALEASAYSEGDTLGSGIEGRRCAAGPIERHGQAQHECPVSVSGFICRLYLIAPLILLTSTFLPRFLAPGLLPRTQPRSRRSKPSRPGHAPRRTQRRNLCPS